MAKIRVCASYTYYFSEEVPDEINRCRHCVYLVEAEDGSLICDDCGKRINEIKNEDCSCEQKW